MESMHDLAQRALDQMPQECRFRPDDAALIRDHKELLLSYEAAYVQCFYGTVYGHPATAAVFTDGERADREATLIQWWRRTANGPLNDQYFAWMAMVGLVHVVRNVSNPMMLAMTDYTATFVAGAVDAAEMDHLEAVALVEAFRRLAVTVGAVISFGYDQAMVSALFSVAGMPEPLLRRLRDQEVAAALADARATIGTR